MQVVVDQHQRPCSIRTVDRVRGNHRAAGGVHQVGRGGKDSIRSASVLQPLEVDHVCGREGSVFRRAVGPATVRPSAIVPAIRGAIIDGRPVERLAALFKERTERVAFPDGAARHTQVALAASSGRDSALGNN